MNSMEQFKKGLNERGVSMEVTHSEDDLVYFRKREGLNNGGVVTIVVGFSANTNIDVRIFDIALITNPLKKEAVLNLINELNVTYRYAKFALSDDGGVFVGYSMMDQDTDITDYLFAMLSMLLEAVSDEYPKFMKLQWS
ncbi:YbjN domain-containing protein [Paenibacillus odorifer]|uniref:YbjN domain-containing protein n=1 Tax=Paenibacillus odorifer TaxID=189426 RepID=A0A1R0Y6P1_9BACL|nr:YbjN domain-containing protein [Paenibacillus odorifer]OMD43033.1 hypothetical protein BSK52_05910 [Paenibacillus odorifer]